MNAKWLGISIVVVALLIVAGVTAGILSTKKAPVTTPTGGVAVAGSPVSKTPLSTDTTATLATAVIPPAQKNVAKILVIKDTSGTPDDPKAPNQDWRVLHLAEVFAYSGTYKLSAEDYSDVSLSSTYSQKGSFLTRLVIDEIPSTYISSGANPVNVLTLTLKAPMPLTRIKVLSRQDCCWDSLDGSKLVLKDSADAIIWSGTLVGTKGLQIFSI